MNCLVTGATGFIGSALTARLVQNNESVTALVHNKPPKHERDTVTYINGDINDTKLIDSITEKIDVVFHCAALVKDYGPKDLFYKINVEGTKNLVT
jgi:nucleoside-diphosphate-sugar epimerase